MIVTQDPVNDSILSLHLGRGMVYKFSQNGKFGQNGKLGHSCTNVTQGKLYGSRDSDHAIVHLGLNVSSSAHIVGAWSMAVMLWQRFEYYYYYYYDAIK